MRCDKCRNEAVFFQAYSGRSLCNRHLVADIEVRAKRSIRSHRWMRTGDHIAVVVSGDRKSAALLKFLKKLTANRRDVRLSAVPVCEDDDGTGDRSAARRVAESLQVPCVKMPAPGCSGTASHGNVTKIAVAVSLDDIAQDVLWQFLFGNADRLVHPPPAEWYRIPVICPFIAVPSDELARYWEIEGSGIDCSSMTSCHDILLQETCAMLEDFSSRHPATRYALLNVAEELPSGNVAALGAAVARTAGCTPPYSILREVGGNGA
jgi:tRNA(Ile)-lysidine synthase TilS/MesJ